MSEENKHVVKYDSLMRCVECGVIATHNVVSYSKDDYRTCTHCGAWFHYHSKTGKTRDLVLVETRGRGGQVQRDHTDEKRSEDYKRSGPSWFPRFHKKRGRKRKK